MAYGLGPPWRGPTSSETASPPSSPTRRSRARFVRRWPNESARYDAALIQLRTGLTDGLTAMRQARDDEMTGLATIAAARGGGEISASIPDQITRIAVGLDNNGGEFQRLSVDETLVRLIRRT